MLEYVPAGQFTQLGEPILLGVDLKDPASHGLQADVMGVKPAKKNRQYPAIQIQLVTVLEVDPAGQGFSVVENAGHCVHAPQSAELAVLLNVPASQGRHWVAPVVPEYVPAPQLTQELDPITLL